MVFYERRLEEHSSKSKIIEFHFDFTEKLKIEYRDISKNVNYELTQIKTKIT